MSKDRDPQTLPEDIYGILDDDVDHKVTEENVEWAGEVFKEVLRTRLKRREQLSGEDVLRFSSLGKKNRQIWYMANKPECAEKFQGKVKLKFLIGDLYEVLLLFLAKESGHSVEDTQYTVEEDGVEGHIDAVIDGVLTDVKSASPYAFEKFKSNSYLFDDPFGYVNQVSGYAHKKGTRRAGFFVANKIDGDLCFVELSREDIDANPPAPRIAELRKVLASKEPPPRCYDDVAEGKSGNRKLGVACSYCRFKFECYKDSNEGKGLRVFKYAKGPVFLTKVVKLPKVEETNE